MNLREADFCIVGAGYAGLTAAYRLKQAGYTVVVVEARERIGGRVWTKYLTDGTPVDMGGTFFGPGQDRAYALAKEMGCETTPTPNKGDSGLMYKGKFHRYKGLIPDLDVLSLASVWASFQLLSAMSKQVPPEAPWTAEKAREWDSMTLAHWIDNPIHALTEPAKVMITALMMGLFTCHPSEVSFLSVLFHIAAAGNDIELQLKVEGGAEQDMVKGGMISIANKVAEKLGDCFVFESPVRAIAYDEHGVTVVSDKVTVKAKRVVVCAPPNLVDHIQFTPGLPATRAQLLQRMPVGRTIKFVAVYEEAFWRKDGLSGEVAAPDEALSISLDTSPPNNTVGTITSFCMGPPAVRLAELSAEERKTLCLKALMQRYGARAAAPVQYFEHDWGADPWTRGCHMAHFAPGILTNFAHVIRQPVGPIHWATTETSMYWNGNIDGAIRSGERAATELIEATKQAAADTYPYASSHQPIN